MRERDYWIYGPYLVPKLRGPEGKSPVPFSFDPRLWNSQKSSNWGSKAANWLIRVNIYSIYFGGRPRRACPTRGCTLDSGLNIHYNTMIILLWVEQCCFCSSPLLVLSILLSSSCPAAKFRTSDIRFIKRKVDSAVPALLPRARLVCLCVLLNCT